MRRRSTRPAPLTGAVSGLLAGLAASYAMTKFQETLARAGAAPSGDGDPTTVKLAERLSGGPIAGANKPVAGEVVHYAFGGLLGLLYGAGTEMAPFIATGYGMPFGLAVALLADELAVPAAGLSAPASQAPASTHVYSIASHVVFGAVLEAGRGLLRR